MYRVSDKITLFALFAFLVLPITTSAAVSQIVFTTDSQTVAPGNTSEAITIQTQDESGTKFSTPETIDLTFQSSSDTGEFLSSSGKVMSKATMNKNTANRTFYYRDSTDGSYEITVNATQRESGGSWSASQTINISSSVPSNPEPPPAPEKVPARTTEKTAVVQSDREPQATATPVVVLKPEPVVTKVVEKVVEKKPTKAQAAAPVVVLDKEPATTTSEVLYTAPKKEGFLSRIWHFILSMLW
jgi:hypothetical protein